MDKYITNNFEKIVLEETPLIDVRAPIEYKKGSFKNSINLPIMNNEERRLVGICYKEKGSDEAFKLGHQLVSNEIRQLRTNNWVSQLQKHPNSILYCFRGGLRSTLSQQWIFDETDKHILRLEGGYKAFRSYLLNALEPSEQKSIPIILGGYTGAGKTIVLNKLENFIDLEKIANHRGSSFGNFIDPQPSQIDFENALSYALIQHNANNYQHMILEDEGRNVGRCFLPAPIRDYFAKGDLIILNSSMEYRIDRTLKEYVEQSQKSYIDIFGQAEGLLKWYQYIVNSITKIKKRLGETGYNNIIQIFENSYKNQLATNTYYSHRDWIKIILKDYYDKMYQYQIDNTSKKIIFEGDAEDVIEYINYNFSQKI